MDIEQPDEPKPPVEQPPIPATPPPPQPIEAQSLEHVLSSDQGVSSTSSVIIILILIILILILIQSRGDRRTRKDQRLKSPAYRSEGELTDTGITISIMRYNNVLIQ